MDQVQHTAARHTSNASLGSMQPVPHRQKQLKPASLTFPPRGASASAMPCVAMSFNVHHSCMHTSTQSSHRCTQRVCTHTHAQWSVHTNPGHSDANTQTQPYARSTCTICFQASLQREADQHPHSSTQALTATRPQFQPRQQTCKQYHRSCQ